MGFIKRSVPKRWWLGKRSIRETPRIRRRKSAAPKVFGGRYDPSMRVAFVVLLLMAGCASTPVKPPEPVSVTANDQALAIRNQAYTLLYGLMSDEKNVSKLLVVKKEAPDVGEILRDISTTAGAAAKELERFSKADSHLHLDFESLPIAEKQTRDSIAKAKAKELISKTGQKFEVRIILTQAEALTYGAHLAAVTQANETDPGRKEYLGKLSQQLQDLHQRVIDLIHSRWQTPGVTSPQPRPRPSERQ